MDFEEFLRFFNGVRRSSSGEAQVKCPAHDDRIASLSIGHGAEGRIVLHCHAGCSNESIVAAVGCTMADLMPKKTATGRAEVAAYDYHDANGKVVFQVVRFEPKDFRQRRPDGGGGWIWNMHNIKRVPYRLPELLAADRGKVVYVCEGEKDVELLRSMGLLATTNPGGAGKWLDSYSEHFEHRIACILPDNDQPGRDHAKRVKGSLERYRADKVEILELPGLPPKGDVYDWFSKPGNTMADFVTMVNEHFTWDSVDKAVEDEELSIDTAEAHSRRFWAPEDLVRNRAILEPEGFVYGEVLQRGTVSLIFGPSGSGKSYFVMYLGAQIALGRPVHGMPTRPGRVLFLSEEMGGPDLKYRSALVWNEEERRDLGPNRFNFAWYTGFDFGGKSLKDNRSVTDFVETCRESNKPDIVFIDSLSKIHNAEENSNQQMGVVMKNLELAARLANVAMVVIHHSGKASEFRTGADRLRGASCIKGSAGDVILVDCISISSKQSVVSFEKTRSLAGKSNPKPFLFTQELDPEGRMITKADGEKVPAVRFVIGEPPEDKRKVAQELVSATIARDALQELVEELGAAGDEVLRSDLIEKLRLIHDDWSDKKCDNAIHHATKRRMIERRGRGKYGLPRF